jgi:glycolate oxidase subunit GlcD
VIGAGLPAELLTELSSVLGAKHVVDGARYATDATSMRGVRGRADAAVLPGSVEEVAGVVRACYQHGVQMIPRGGGTGLAGGAVPVDGGVVISLERLARLRSLEPELWRMEVEAGMTTRNVQRLAREAGLYFPPDPGAAEQSQIGGNVATNAGGPHALKYGTTGSWVTGLEVVVAPGDILSTGGPIRKEVVGYDLKRLLVGSEGTLGIITSAWLRLIPAPEASAVLVAFYSTTEAGTAAVYNVMGSGIVPATLDYLDAATIALVGGAVPVPGPHGFTLLVEVDGSAEDVQRQRDEMAEALSNGALGVHEPPAAELWRWREGVAWGVVAHRGGKLSEDIVVPLEHLGEAVESVLAIGRRHGLAACSWGHAGDGNLHATFLIDPGSERELAVAERAASDVFELAERLGGAISGEHGIGLVKRDYLGGQWTHAERRLQTAIKRTFDPQGLMNPGKKVAV